MAQLQDSVDVKDPLPQQLSQEHPDMQTKPTAEGTKTKPDGEGAEPAAASSLGGFAPLASLASGASLFGSMMSSAASQLLPSASEPRPEQQQRQDMPNPEQHPDGPEVAKADAKSGFFSLAMNQMADLSKAMSSWSAGSAGQAKTESPEADAQPNDQPEVAGVPNSSSGFLSRLPSMVGKVAADAGHVIKDKMSHPASFLEDFNKEQEDFIQSKERPDVEVGVAPWQGHKEEKAMKQKILALSEDKRNFIRAPPLGVTFEFEYGSVAPIALALLQHDAKLQSLRYQLVPKTVKEEEFWRNYFYRINLIQQSFELQDLQSSGLDQAKEEQKQKAPQVGQPDSMKPSRDKEALTSMMVDEEAKFHDPDDEFVSDSYQASSKDMDEVNESLKRLGVKGGGPGNDEEWEAELEGELNEFEVVSKEGSPQNAQWESEIQELIDAEEQKT